MHAPPDHALACFPSSPEMLARLLGEAAAAGRSLAVFGNGSRQLMAGPSRVADLRLSTARLTRVLEYQPNDLTISVEAGMPWAELQRLLAEHGQMVALDPPFTKEGTVGGVVAANASGPLRARYGTARDLVIGMQFATLEGKLARCGGMVVKNVAGLDLGKLLIGSFGTLAAITSVNFRLHPLPEETCTFLFRGDTAEIVLEHRRKLLASVLRPLAVDLIGPGAAKLFARDDFLLAVRAGGSHAVLARYRRELAEAEEVTGAAEQQFWEQLREFPRDFLAQRSEGIVLRVSTPLADLGLLLQHAPAVFVARAVSGVTYLYGESWSVLEPAWRAAAENKWLAVIEYASETLRRTQTLWQPAAGDGFAMMKDVKSLFDPDNLLNASRLYGRL